MDLGAAGLREQPFPTHGKPLAVIKYRSQQAALDMLRDTLEHPAGLSLLQGPALSGKSILIRSFVESVKRECEVAVVDGRQLNTTNLLLAILQKFGYDIDLSSTNELLGLLRVFALQQSASSRPPFLIIKNTDQLTPSGLRALCELANIRTNLGGALKMALVSDHSLATIVNSPGMTCIADRLLHDFHLRPMTRLETRNYLHEKLQAAGADSPASVFPNAVCDEFYDASGGWPGILDRIALLALANGESLPIEKEVIEHPALPSGTWDEEVTDDTDEFPVLPADPPRLIVTNNESIIEDLTMHEPHLLIGRSKHNNVSIGSRFISRHHALVVRHADSTFLMDLNSTNGTYVNGKRVTNYVLINDDVITIGHHKIKFVDPSARKRRKLKSPDLEDTALMKTLEDMRKLRAREETKLLPAVGSEDLPTIQT